MKVNLELSDNQNKGEMLSLQNGKIQAARALCLSLRKCFRPQVNSSSVEKDSKDYFSQQRETQDRRRCAESQGLRPPHEPFYKDFKLLKFP